MVYYPTKISGSDRPSLPALPVWERSQQDGNRAGMPEGKRMASCLCFDFDTLISLWLGLFRFNTANPLSRGEFGATVAVPRILALLDRHDLRATWFVPAHTAQVFPDAVKALADRGHEVAAHSMYHAPYEVGLATSGIPPASPERQRGYIEEQTEILERVTGRRPTRLPLADRRLGGRARPQRAHRVRLHLRQQPAGPRLQPYRLRLGDTYAMEEPFAVTFGEESPLLEIPLHWDTNDFAQFEFLGYYLNPENPWFSPAPFGTVEQVLANFTGSFDACHEHVPGGVWNTILHPQCCGRDMKLTFLDRLFAHVRDHDDVWVATMSEVTDAYDDALPDPTPGLAAATVT